MGTKVIVKNLKEVVVNSPKEETLVILKIEDIQVHSYSDFKMQVKDKLEPNLKVIHKLEYLVDMDLDDVDQ